MQLVRSDRSFPFTRVARGCVATIGAFDGLHLGHRYLLDRTLAEASDRELPSVVMSFEPTPKEYFLGRQAPGRLTSFREKFETLKDMGFDIFFCPRFDQSMSKISADTFIRTLLVHAMSVRHLIVGDDFRFARNRQGTLEHLQRVGGPLLFSVEHVPSIVVEGERVSSTAIRAALGGGDLERATRLIGKPYRMSGKVMRKVLPGGDRENGIALVSSRHRRSPIRGMFAVKVTGIGNTVIDTIACVGTCGPDGSEEPVVLLRYPGQIEDPVGNRVGIEFLDRISAQCNDESVDELAAYLYQH